MKRSGRLLVLGFLAASTGSYDGRALRPPPLGRRFAALAAAAAESALERLMRA
jgi:hypothetical protein